MSLQKITNLIKKTGDKAIVLDQYGEPNYVNMTLADYEDLILGKAEVEGLTEEELLDKINRDIELWKGSQEDEDLPIDQYDFSQELSKFSKDDLDSEISYNEVPGKDGQLPAETGLSTEEDRYYFEPVEA